MPGDLRSLAAAAPPGVYTVTRTYQGNKFVLLEAHLERLRESALLEGFPFQWEPREIFSGLRELLEVAGFPDARVRLALPEAHPQQLHLAAEPLSPIPSELKTSGVAAATIHLDRRNPHAKTTEWERTRLAALSTLPDGCYEGLLIDSDGAILEGFTSNFFALREDKLFTAAEGILHGISRRIVFRSAGKLLPIIPKPILRDEIGSVEEAFLTSSSRGVVPIVEIDGQTISDGKPGGWTAEISRRYDRWVEANMRSIEEYLIEREAHG